VVLRHIGFPACGSPEAAWAGIGGHLVVFTGQGASAAGEARARRISPVGPAAPRVIGVQTLTRMGHCVCTLGQTVWRAVQLVRDGGQLVATGGHCVAPLTTVMQWVLTGGQKVETGGHRVASD